MQSAAIFQDVKNDEEDEGESAADQYVTDDT